MLHIAAKSARLRRHAAAPTKFAKTFTLSTSSIFEFSGFVTIDLLHL